MQREDEMKQITFSQPIIIAALGFLGWALCGAIMFIGMSVMSIETTLIVHAIGAPVGDSGKSEHLIPGIGEHIITEITEHLTQGYNHHNINTF